MEPRVATADDADEVGRIIAAGFLADPVMGWVFSEPDRAAKLEVMFAFLAREAQVPLGATWISDGAACAWTPADPPPVTLVGSGSSTRRWPPTTRGSRTGTSA